MHWGGIWCWRIEWMSVSRAFSESALSCSLIPTIARHFYQQPDCSGDLSALRSGGKTLYVRGR